MERCTSHLVMGLRTMSTAFTDLDWICYYIKLTCYCFTVDGVFRDERSDLCYPFKDKIILTEVLISLLDS